MKIFPLDTRTKLSFLLVTLTLGKFGLQLGSFIKYEIKSLGCSDRAICNKNGACVDSYPMLRMLAEQRYGSNHLLFVII